nr:MAG: ORF1 [TTV-like mini virus]UGV37327.1 MAG: ORF1 [TTV-like mini virus]UGV38692.1 MAG: ORF1 [TTV-like mini virus]
MPYYPFRTYYRRRYFNRRRKWKPRRRFRLWRPRSTLFRRWNWRRPRRVRRRYFFKRKKKNLILRQWQPHKINKCKIKGLMCLFQAGPHRISNNWTQYMNSTTPELWDGGGGWSQLKFSLNSLYEQRQYVRNVWTKSNVALPLVRYTGCMFKFYRTQDTDYIVHYKNCLPMLDTEQQHTNAQPSAMLMYRKKILVPSFKTEPHKRKPYIKKRIKPPPQLQNKWYFQQDLADTGLLMITTTACDLDRFYLSKLSVSNSITIRCLNTRLFQSRNFQQTDLGETYWGPKSQYWLWSGHSDLDTPLEDLIFLGQTQRRHPGHTIKQIKDKFSSWPGTKLNYSQRIEMFGNIFDPAYLKGDDQVMISTGTLSPDQIFNKLLVNGQKTKTAREIGLGMLTQPLLVDCRYTPNKDTGIGNQVYFLKNTRNEENWDAPAQSNLSLTGYPLWLAFWGYADWHKKVHLMQQIDLNYILTFKTDFLDQKLPGYVTLDETFFEGYSPYRHEDSHPSILPEDTAHWLPKFKYQQVAIDNICKTGPGTVKTSKNSIEAHCFYKFYFKWGGCPNELENIADPVQQPKYPLPSKLIQGIEIQNPESSPTKELYDFDFRRQMLTKKAAKRITKDSTTTTTLFTDSTAWSADPQAEETPSEKTQESEEEETAESVLLDLQLQQRQLRNRIFKLMRHTPKLQFSNLK